MRSYSPAYLTAYKNGDLQKKCDSACAMLQNCQLCPRRCHVNRAQGATGFCNTGNLAKVASFNAHFGEEAPLSGQFGSGTIFFSHCNLGCIFCQNYEISHLGWGETVLPDQIADMMLQLQQMGCHNINLVTPSHVVPQILAALIHAAERGLKLPLVFNTSAYDRIETLKLLDGIVDIYMPDFKFWSSNHADTYCGASDYPEVARRSIMEMHRQVGDLRMDSDGIARKGLLLRHLVMPGGILETTKILEFIAQKISINTYVNIMSQYRPCGTAKKIKEINTMVGIREYRQAINVAKDLGVVRIDGRLPHKPSMPEIETRESTKPSSN